ncbi:porin [Salmonella enterica subsp. enterica serovar Newport]|nr:porin [Salmonella enterica]ECV9281488.1 porin [Salmonella enterica subsp. enterica serovar Newport]EDX2614159.1 porin [Salmonella enterica subsp. enterica serovar 4,[5],12:i:-]EDT4634208.1 porin [Salmonella enterica]EEH3763306.1 porin [Salmonella enterica subsp. enterica serovar 4,[5],12:i:-]
MFLEWFLSALIPQRLAVQFCCFGEFFFMCLLERVKMKKSILLGFAGMLFVSASAQAISISGQAGEDYTNIGVGFGTESTGLALSGNWMHNDDDGDAAGVGLGLNIPVGPLLATVGGKGIYTNPKDSDEGYAAAVGGGLQWKIGNSFRLFGEYYYSPDSLSSGIDSYEEANAGARFTIMRPLSIEAGYRYLNLAGKDGNRDNAIADGPYVGVNASF